jgi:RNA polymerase sigma factor for flagellar operon FliA
MNTESLWADYRANPSVAARNSVAEAYRPLVAGIAMAMQKSLVQRVDLQDLIQDGMIGLLEAIAKYDPTKNDKFVNYAKFRIHGAMIDALRNMDDVPRLTRKREKRFAELEKKLGREPTEDEVVREFDVCRVRAKELIRERPRPNVSTESKMVRLPAGKWLSVADVVPAKPVRERLRTELLTMNQGFSRTERAILCLYYGEDLTMREIAQAIGVTESRVSQAHKNILQRLKARMLECAA